MGDDDLIYDVGGGVFDGRMAFSRRKQRLAMIICRRRTSTLGQLTSARRSSIGRIHSWIRLTRFVVLNAAWSARLLSSFRRFLSVSLSSRPKGHSGGCGFDTNTLPPTNTSVLLVLNVCDSHMVDALAQRKESLHSFLTFPCSHCFLLFIFFFSMLFRGSSFFFPLFYSSCIFLFFWSFFLCQGYSRLIVLHLQEG